MFLPHIVPTYRRFQGSDAQPNRALPSYSVGGNDLIQAAHRKATLSLNGCDERSALGYAPTVDDTLTLTGRRRLAISALLREQGVRSVPAPAAGLKFQLAAAIWEQQP